MYIHIIKNYKHIIQKTLRVLCVKENQDTLIKKENISR